MGYFLHWFSCGLQTLLTKFTGKMIHKSGAGPKPINHKDLTVKKLRDALVYATGPIAKEAASSLAQKIHDEVISIMIEY